MSLVTTDLPVATAGNGLHLFYQNGAKIYEVRSSNSGSAWTAQDEVIAEDGNPNTGSAMTACFVEKDADYGGQQTIHLLYINSSGNLVEKFKRMSGDKTIWENIPLADAVKKGPESNSRLTGGAWNGSGWNATGSQWNYFASIQEGKQAITEIRRTPKGAWYTETILPQNWGDALPGTDLACTISNGVIKVFFQDHEYNIALYEHKNGAWDKRGVYIDKSKVQPTTPLAVTRSENGKTHLFYAGQTGNIVHSIDGSDSKDLVKFYPGSKLGATSVGDKLTLFYRSLNPVGEVVTHENDDGSWKPGVTVIKA
ncbi:fucose-specific lectin protein [Rutstroemia sp. NJR-2017a BBW]|nr:fucose-specific lectin protein [Rutstroemia sp. NJR-2017a BBW]